MSSPSPASAEAVLQRLLVLLPMAAREEGVRIEDAAARLGVDARRLLQDLEEFDARSDYLPPGLGDRVQLRLTRERLFVWTTGEFRRPPRLSPKEALALELALRVVRRSSSGEKDAAFQALGRRLVGVLTNPSTRPTDGPPLALSGVEEEDPIRTRVEEALRSRRELRLLYGAPGREPSWRRAAPLLLAHAEGRWYLLARDRDRGELRAFRLDRTLEVEEGERTFVPSREDEEAAEAYLGDGRIRAGGPALPPETFEAVIEYSPRIARWIRERGWQVEKELESGGIRVRHRVVDREWLLGHLLSYGAEARLMEPEWMRAHVREAAVKLHGRDRL